MFGSPRLLASMWCLVAGEQCLLQLPRRSEPAKPLAAELAKEQQPSASAESAHWYVFGIENYSVSNPAKAYAWVTVEPEQLNYMSRVRKASTAGKIDLHLYVSKKATSARIDLYDEISWGPDVLLGSATIALTSQPGWCDLGAASSSGCPFSRDLEEDYWSWSGGWKKRKVGWVAGYLATGPYLEKQVEDLHMRGVAVKSHDYSFARTKFTQARIKNDAVEEAMSYAKTGSVFPSSLHGIWWMDQRGVHLPIPSDEGYQQVCSVAEDEVLMSWGQADWDPETRCAAGVSLKSAGPLKGQWTFLDQTGEGSESVAFYSGISGTLDFCFEEGSSEEVAIWMYASLNSVAHAILSLSHSQWSGLTTLPRQLVSYKLVRKSWGWDRASTLGPDWLRSFIIKAFGGIMGNAGLDGKDPDLHCHYPLFQVIDGDGKKTEHYAAYLSYVNEQTTCKEMTFDCPRNRGNGTQMTPRLVG